MSMHDEFLKDIGLTSSDMKTFGRLNGGGQNGSMLSAEDSLVSPSVRPANGEGRMTNDGYGLNLSECFAFYDRDTHLLKTRQASLLLGWSTFCETLPRSGLMRNGMLFQRPPLVPLTSGNGFGYLPTPQASSDSMGGMGVGMAKTCFRKEQGERRPSGAKIGSSLNWSPEFVYERLRTGGELNPEWIEVLMGYPVGWTAITHSETPLSPKSSNGSADESLNTNNDSLSTQTTDNQEPSNTRGRQNLTDPESKL